MSETRKDAADDQLTVEQWLQIRKEEGLRIVPETAEVMYWHRRFGDPYSLGLDLPDDLQLIGREYFARSIGSDIWVWFEDLPAETAARLWKTHRLWETYIRIR